MTSPRLQQVEFRGRADTQALNSTTFDNPVGGANLPLNTNWTQPVDVPFRVRFTIAEVDGGMANNVAFSLQYNLAGAGFVAIGDTAAVKSALSGQFDNAAPTTQVISTGSFVAGAGYEQTTTSNISLQSNRTEIEWCLSIDSAQVTNGQTFTLRVVQAAGAVLQDYLQTPTITVSEEAAPEERLVTDGLELGDEIATETTRAPRILEQLASDGLFLDDAAAAEIEHTIGDDLLLDDAAIAERSAAERAASDFPFLDDAALLVREFAQADGLAIDDAAVNEAIREIELAASDGLFLDDAATTETERSGAAVERLADDNLVFSEIDLRDLGKIVVDGLGFRESQDVTGGEPGEGGQGPKGKRRIIYNVIIRGGP